MLASAYLNGNYKKITQDVCVIHSQAEIYFLLFEEHDAAAFVDSGTPELPL